MVDNTTSYEVLKKMKDVQHSKVAKIFKPVIGTDLFVTKNWDNVGILINQPFAFAYSFRRRKQRG